MVFSFWIGAFCNLPLMLHNFEQRNSAKLPIADFPHFAFYHRSSIEVIETQFWVKSLSGNHVNATFMEWLEHTTCRLF